MAVRAFLCWVLAGSSSHGDSAWLFPAALGRAGRVQGVQRDAGGRRTPAAARGPDPGHRQRPDLHGRHGRGRRSRRRSPSGRRRSGRSGRCATPSWSSSSPPSWRSGSPPRRLQPGRGRRSASCGRRTAGARRRRRRPHGKVRIPAVDGLRAPGQLRPALALGLPHALHGVPAARPPDRRSLAAVPARRGDRRGRPRQHHRHRRRLADEAGEPEAHGGRWRCWPAAAAAILGALFYGLFSLVVLGFVAGLAQCLAKLSLDSTIQRDVPDRVRTSAFARSDTTLQLAWVIGGFVGIALPLDPRLGLIVAAVVLVGVVGVRARRTADDVRRQPRPPRRPRTSRECDLELELVGEGAQQLGGRLGLVASPGGGRAGRPRPRRRAGGSGPRRSGPSPRASCGVRATGCARRTRARRGPAPGAPGRRGGPGRSRTPRGCRP